MCVHLHIYTQTYKDVHKYVIFSLKWTYSDISTNFGICYLGLLYFTPEKNCTWLTYDLIKE